MIPQMDKGVEVEDPHGGRFSESKLISPPEFLVSFTQASEEARKRVMFETMTYLEDGPFSNTITSSLIAASKRGVDVRFKYDASSLICLDGHIGLTPVSLRRRSWSQDIINHGERTRRRLQEMSDARIKVAPQSELNVLTKILPFLGRSHSKLAVVDERAWVSNINLTQAHLGYPAFIYETKNGEAVERVADLIKDGSIWTRKDGTVQCGQEVSLIVDSGRPFSSPIYDFANRRVQQGSDLIVVFSPYLPQRRLLTNLLLAEKRGCQVLLVTSEEDTTKGRLSPYGIAKGLFEDQIRGRGGFSVVRVHGLIGARGVLTDRSFLTGSHTLSEYGMWFGGTKEVAVETTEEKVLRDAKLWLERI